MSTLQDRISRNRKVLAKGQDGTLQEVQEQDLQQLAGQAGLATPPTDAMSAATLGAGPHTQKMMGSPAQVQAAVRMAQDPNQNLQTASRRQDAGRDMTTTEQASQKKSQGLAEVGSLGSRVNNFIEAQRQKIASSNLQASQQQVAAAPTVQGLPSDPGQLAKLKDAAKLLLTNPQDMNALLQLNQSLGRDINTTVTSDQIKQLYETSNATLSRFGAEVVDDSLQVEDLVASGGLGYDLGSLAPLLNLSPDVLGKMSVGQLRDQIQRVTEQEFQKTAVIEQQASSNVLGSAERMLARQSGQELSATGVRATEQDMARLEQSIRNADQVQFGGQTYQVDDLLRDETVSKIITDYLQAAPGTPTRTQLEASEPGLIQFIQRNQAVISDAASKLEAGAKAFTAVQDSNQAIGKVGSTSLDPGLVKELLPEYGTLQAQNLNTTSIPFFQTLAALPPNQKETFAATANALVQDPATADVKEEFKGLTPAQLQALHLEQGLASPALQALKQNRQEHQKLKSLESNPDGILKTLTGGTVQSTKDAAALVKQDTAARVLGLQSGGPNVLDQNGDGQLDQIDQLYRSMLDATPRASLKDAAEGRTPVFQPVSIRPYEPNDPREQTLLSRLGQVASDGVLTPDEVAGANLNEQELWDIVDMGLASRWGEAGRTVGALVQESRKRNTEQTLAPYGLSTEYLQYVKQNPELENIDLGNRAAGTVPSQPRIDQILSTIENAKGARKSLIDTIAASKMRENGRRLDLGTLEARLNEMDQNIVEMSQEAQRQIADRNYILSTLQKTKDENDAADKEYRDGEHAKSTLAGKLKHAGTTISDIGKGITAPVVPAGTSVSNALKQFLKGTVHTATSAGEGLGTLVGGVQDAGDRLVSGAKATVGKLKKSSPFG